MNRFTNFSHSSLSYLPTYLNLNSFEAWSKLSPEEVLKRINYGKRNLNQYIMSIAGYGRYFRDLKESMEEY